MLMLMDVR